jgi:hypothetical protein
VGEGADAFVNDGVVTAFIPWVKEEREVHEMHTLPPMKQGVIPEDYFANFLHGVYKGKIFKKRDRDGWSWQVLDDLQKMTWFDVEFYTVGDMIEMDAQKRSVVFDGPRPIVKDYEDILAPVRCANLQIPSPSNPGGAAHVIMVDYPTLDEIKRLEKSGFYDLIDEDDLAKLGVTRMDETMGSWRSSRRTYSRASSRISRRPTPRVPARRRTTRRSPASPASTSSTSMAMA